MAKPNKFHVSENGPGPCTAEIQNCPVGGEHFENEAQAQQVFEERMEAEHSLFEGTSKTSEVFNTVFGSGTGSGHDKYPNEVFEPGNYIQYLSLDNLYDSGELDDENGNGIYEESFGDDPYAVIQTSTGKDISRSDFDMLRKLNEKLTISENAKGFEAGLGIVNENSLSSKEKNVLRKLGITHEFTADKSFAVVSIDKILEDVPGDKSGDYVITDENGNLAQAELNDNFSLYGRISTDGTYEEMYPPTDKKYLITKAKPGESKVYTALSNKDPKNPYNPHDVIQSKEFGPGKYVQYYSMDNLYEDESLNDKNGGSIDLDLFKDGTTSITNRNGVEVTKADIEALQNLDSRLAVRVNANGFTAGLGLAKKSEYTKSELNALKKVGMFDEFTAKESFMITGDTKILEDSNEPESSFEVLDSQGQARSYESKLNGGMFVKISKNGEYQDVYPYNEERFSIVTK